MKIITFIIMIFCVADACEHDCCLSKYKFHHVPITAPMMPDYLLINESPSLNVIVFKGDMADGNK